MTEPIDSKEQQDKKTLHAKVERRSIFSMSAILVASAVASACGVKKFFGIGRNNPAAATTKTQDLGNQKPDETSNCQEK